MKQLFVIPADTDSQTLNLQKEEDSSHICCEFHYKNWCDSI